MYVSPWAVSYREKYFHEPYSFKPERWIDPDCKDVKEASQPFSLGPRVCPGKL
jgi:cytochrome P450